MLRTSTSIDCFYWNTLLGHHKGSTFIFPTSTTANNYSLIPFMDFSNTVTRVFNELTLLDPPEAPSLTRSETISDRKSNILTLLMTSSSSAAKHIFLTLHFLFPHDLLPALDLLDRGLVSCFIANRHSKSNEETSSTAVNIITHTTSSQNSNSPREVYYVQSASAVTDNPRFHTHAHNSANSAQEGTSTTATASPNQGRFRNALRPKATDTFYEIRLDSWNCSCAAFAFNALTLLSLVPEPEMSTANFSADHTGQSKPPYVDRFTVPGSTVDGSMAQEYKDKLDDDFRFGGALTKPGMPAPVCKHILAACLARSLPVWAWGAVEARTGLPWRRDEKSTELMAGWSGGWGDS